MLPKPLAAVLHNSPLFLFFAQPSHHCDFCGGAATESAKAAIELANCTGQNGTSHCVRSRMWWLKDVGTALVHTHLPMLNLKVPWVKWKRNHTFLTPGEISNIGSCPSMLETSSTPLAWCTIFLHAESEQNMLRHLSNPQAEANFGNSLQT